VWRLVVTFLVVCNSASPNGSYVTTVEWRSSGGGGGESIAGGGACPPLGGYTFYDISVGVLLGGTATVH
jgi:hypothetical protein